MVNVKVAPGQTLADIAIQHCGSLSAWPDLARLNGLGLTEDIEAGQMLMLPAAYDKRTVAFFKSGGFVPAVGVVVVTGEGIGYWFIESDLIVQ